MNVSPLGEPRVVYERLRKRFGGFTPRKASDVPEGESVAYGQGRDPRPMADAFADLSTSMGWTSDLARADLMEQWAQIVGPEVALHATPVGVEKGVLEVHCDSSAWATQLRMMRGQLVSSLREKFPDADIAEVAIKAPGAPSWKHGPRSVPGRGPRDTYG